MKILIVEDEPAAAVPRCPGGAGEDLPPRSLRAVRWSIAKRSNLSRKGVKLIDPSISVLSGFCQ